MRICWEALCASFLAISCCCVSQRRSGVQSSNNLDDHLIDIRHALEGIDLRSMWVPNHTLLTSQENNIVVAPWYQILGGSIAAWACFLYQRILVSSNVSKTFELPNMYLLQSSIVRYVRDLEAQRCKLASTCKLLLSLPQYAIKMISSLPQYAKNECCSFNCTASQVK